MIEVAIAIGISTLLLILAAQILQSTTAATSQVTVRSNLAIGGELVLRQAVDDLGNAQPLGDCQDTRNPYTIPFTYCPHPISANIQGSSQVGPSLYSATPRGLCYFAYTIIGTFSATPSLSGGAPSLQCVWLDSANRLYVNTYIPTTSGTGGGNPTYTDCSPGETATNSTLCWAGAPAVGTVPTSVVSCGAPGPGCPRQYLLGTIVPTTVDPSTGLAQTAAQPFVYYDSNRAPVIVGGTTPPTPGCSGFNGAADPCLAGIALVQFDIQLQHTNFDPAIPNAIYRAAHTKNFSFQYLASIRGSIYQRAQQWDQA